MGTETADEADGAADLLVGRLLGGKFLIQHLLGAGGMGRIYVAEQINLRKQVALKVLHANLSTDAQLAKRFNREAKYASMLSHPNILQIIDFGDDDGVLFIAMELLAGKDLSRVQRENGPLDPRRIGRIGAQVLSALEEAHAKGVVHRDLKPENIMLLDVRGEPDFVKVCDFGMAKVSADRGGATSVITDAGTLCGTVEYMSPEQARGLTLDGRSDLYAMAIILYELVVRDVPFRASTTMGVVTKHLHEQPEPPSRRVPSILPALEEVILKGLQKSRDDRFASAAEMRRALLEAVGMPASASPAPARTPRDGAVHALPDRRPGIVLPRPSQRPTRLQHIRPPRKRLAQMVAGAAALLACLVAVVVRLAGRHPAPAHPAAVERAPRRAVAVLGFKNLSGRTDTAWLSTALAEMLSMELGDGDRLRTLSGEDVARMKAELRLPAADSLGYESLTRIRRDLDADLVVLGAYAAVESLGSRKVRIDLRVQDTAAGETAASASEVGTEAELFELIARVGQKLRLQLGAATSSDADERAARAALPANVEAARAYAEGLARLRLYDARTAREWLTRAVAADPAHAPSHVALAQAWSALGYDSRAQEEAKHALALAGPLGRQQRMAIEAYHHVTMHDWPKAIAAYQLLFDFFPDKLDYGLQLAEAQVQSEHAAQALETVDRLRDLPVPLRDDPRIDLTRCHALMSLGDHRAVVEAAATAKQKAQTRGADVIRAMAARWEALGYMRLGECDQTSRAAEEAKAIFARVGDRRGMALANTAVSICLADRSDSAGALRINEETLALCEEIGDRSGVATALNNSANDLDQLGRRTEALARYERAAAIHRELNQTRWLNSVSGNIAWLQFRQGDLVGARHRTAEAIEVARRMDDRSYLAHSLLQQASILLPLGKLELARRHLEEGIAIARQLGEQPKLAWALTRSAAQLIEGGKLDEARQTLEDTQRLDEKLGDVPSAMWAKLDLAGVFVAAGQATTGEQLAREAAAYFDEKPSDIDARSSVHQSLAYLLVGQGKIAAARRELERAIAAAPAESSFEPRIQLALTWARVEAAEGHLTAAKRRVARALAECRRAHHVQYELDGRLALVEMAQRQHATLTQRTLARALHADAMRRGFALVAKKAAALADYD